MTTRQDPRAAPGPHERWDGPAPSLDALSFCDDADDVSAGEVPQPSESGTDEDVLVPRSVKLPLWLDTAVADLAAAAGMTKSTYLRQLILDAVQQGPDAEADPLSVAELALLRAASAVGAARRLPRSA